MNQKDKAHYKKLLLNKRKELTDQMEFIKKMEMESTLKEASGDHSAYAFHMADQGTDSMEREKNLYYVQRDGRLLYHIDQALDRIEEDSFGLCEACKNRISRERLEAVPHARFCIECKSKSENNDFNSTDSGESE